MTTVDLYKPGKWTRAIAFPTTWDELHAGELEAIAGILLSDGSRQALLLQLLAGRARMHGARLPAGWQQLLDFEQAAIDGLPLIDGLLADNTRTVNPYPMLAGYYGPADAFNDLTVGEFEDAEVMAGMYQSSHDDQYLVKLAAALWRPLGANRKRIAYTDYEAPVASFSRRVATGNLHAIYLWYVGCRGQLVALFPDVFGGGAGAGQADAGPDLTAFTRLVHGAAGPKNGTRAQVRATPLKELLFDCQIAAEQAAEMEAEMKKNTR